MPRKYGDLMATPEEMWTGKKPDISHLRVFGCVVYAQLAKEQRGKLDSTSIAGIFVGYTPTSRQYRVYDPTARQVQRYSTVRFDESTAGGMLLTTTDGNRVAALEEEIRVDLIQPTMPGRQALQEIGDTIEVRGRTPTTQGEEPAKGMRDASESTGDLRDADEAAVERQSRSRRAIRLPQRYQAQRATTDPEIATPITYDEAVSGPQNKQWEAAITEELKSLASNGVWTLVKRPDGANIMSSKWVFKIKRLPSGQISRYKARVVARGFSQQYGVDYYETFAPVVRMESLRILLAIAAIEDLEVHQMDVVTAYLTGVLPEEIYMAPPQGLPGAAQKVCRLNKGLYGLKQSARVWNQRIEAELTKAGLKAIPTDQSIWVNADFSLILALYVDDIVLFARETQALRRIKEILQRSFHMKDLGPVSTILGIRVRRDRAKRMLWINQSHYINEVLKEFQHTD
jgi:Reverse transcriptase (RNA-dependent DNA polymerase)